MPPPHKKNKALLRDYEDPLVSLKVGRRFFGPATNFLGVNARASMKPEANSLGGAVLGA